MHPPVIESYRFGQMVVDGKIHNKDVILLPDRVVPGWWRQQGHRLDARDLDEVFSAHPKVLVVGTGAHGVMQVPEQTRRAIADANIELRVACSTDAWQVYNELSTQRPTAGAFHLTC